MAFVKLDTDILNSTLWLDADACKVFITALLMAKPFELKEPLVTLQVRTTDPANFVVPAGWYGMVAAAGPGIVRQATLDQEAGLDALERLADVDPGSRTADFDGRRMVRINGGYLILNYMAHRDRDHTAAERQARFRQREKARKSNGELRGSNAVTITPVTHAYAYADAIHQELKATERKIAQEPAPDSEADDEPKPPSDVKEPDKRRKAQTAVRFPEFWAGYPVKKGKVDALKKWKLKGCDAIADQIVAHVRMMESEDQDWKTGFIPHGSTYINGELWEDEPKRQLAAEPPPAESFGAKAALAKSESKLENELGYIRQQRSIGAYGDGAAADAEMHRRMTEATNRHRGEQ